MYYGERGVLLAEKTNNCHLYTAYSATKFWLLVVQEFKELHTFYVTMQYLIDMAVMEAC